MNEPLGDVKRLCTDGAVKGRGCGESVPPFGLCLLRFAVFDEDGLVPLFSEVPLFRNRALEKCVYVPHESPRLPKISHRAPCFLSKPWPPHYSMSAANIPLRPGCKPECLSRTERRPESVTVLPSLSFGFSFLRAGPIQLSVDRHLSHAGILPSPGSQTR